MQIKDAIAEIVEGNDLSEKEAVSVMKNILKGKATASQIASLITALRMKGETVPEITGFAKAMRAESVRVKFPGRKAVDTCGTGGDMSNTLNISTTAAFVAAGAGVTIAKHGNRSVSSRCGSADVLQKLGVNIMMGRKAVEECLRKVGIAFMFAPMFHSAMKHALPPRREIGIRTVFNILGPITNPAGAKAQVLGVYDGKLLKKLANVLLNLGSVRAMVVHGLDGLDEISLNGTEVAEVKNGKVITYTLNPRDYGFKKVPITGIAGGSLSQHARSLRNVLKGEKGPRRDVVLLNAGAAIYAGGKAKNIREGIGYAADSIDSGRAFEKLELLKKFSNSPAVVK
jgi:anthranilate phosphoribosyltransferase